MKRKHHPSNERIKREYLLFLRDAKGQSDDTLDVIGKALDRFEEDTGRRDFKTFHYEQARAFKRHLAEQKNSVTGKNLSKSTVYATLMHLRRFFEWLAFQPGYRSRVQYKDAEYFNLSDKDSRVATARQPVSFPSVDQVKHVLVNMPGGTVVEQRNRALVALALLTGARDSALASMKLKHIDLEAGSVYQDAREVKTKFSKTFTTFFFPVGQEIVEPVAAWVAYLRNELRWDGDAPLFPATQMSLNEEMAWSVAGVKPEHWRSAAPVRRIFKDAFQSAGLPYFHPHSIRHTLAHLGTQLCRTPEEMKGWSQNLGHEGVLTTLYSYGTVANIRQKELLQAMNEPRSGAENALVDFLEEALRKARRNQ